MAYTLNPRLPRLRARACEMVKQGKTVTEVAKYFGYSKGTISKWLKKYPAGGVFEIPTKSSRPKKHPKQSDAKVVNRIVELRLELNGRCGEVIHDHLKDEGIAVSLRTVQRVLDRKGLLNKRSPWKRWHISIPRPIPENAGDLVQIDTIHIWLNKKERFYIYALLDVYSRWAYALVSRKINTYESLKFIRQAIKKAPFKIKVLQSDHGSEFSTYFTEHIQKDGMVHRHSRVRRPNDNGHLERFNRTIQEEALTNIPKHPIAYQLAINHYLPYYNNQRKHLGINLKTPQFILQNRFQAIV